ncbi:MAG: phosphatidylserine/phosphatidylglycerophosphate/cardiolipin synthase family protein [Anaerolineae bacterium]
MRMKLLVDSDEFWMNLRQDLLSSKEHVFIQTFSFEGDRIGKMLSNLLLSSGSVNTRIIVDCFTRWMLNDKFLYAPKNLLDGPLRREARATVRMIKELEHNGIRVKFTNPVGLLLPKFAARNHKKLVLIDDTVAYIGGMNFSEHNFSWHDMMLRIEDRNVAEMLKRDFLSTWGGCNSSTSERFRGIEIHALDGHSNNITFDAILRLIEDAKERVFVASPYLTFPFFASLRKASRKSVAVTIMTPEENNRTFMKEYILWESGRSGIETRLYRKMTHLKAILIDDEYLVVGSSNFDYWSYRLHQEIVAIVTDAQVISEFKEKVIQEDLKNSRGFDDKINGLRGHILNLGLRSLGEFFALVNQRM